MKIVGWISKPPQLGTRFDPRFLGEAIKTLISDTSEEHGGPKIEEKPTTADDEGPGDRGSKYLIRFLEYLTKVTDLEHALNCFTSNQKHALRYCVSS